MRDEDEGGAKLALDFLEGELELLAELEIQRRQGLVQQKDRGFQHQRSRKSHPLLLAAGQLRDAPAAEVAEPDEVEEVPDLPAQFRLRHIAQAQAVGDVLVDRKMRKQRQVLENHADRPALRRQARHVAPVDRDRPGAGRDEASDQSQQCGLAAAGRTEQRDEGTGFDREIEARKHGRRAIGLRNAGNLDGASGRAGQRGMREGFGQG